MSNKKKTILIVALLLVVFIGSISYALWSVTLEQTDSNIVKTGCFTVDMVEQTDEINLPEEYPVKDEEGRKYSPFTFTIQNTCTIDSSYSVNLKVEDGTTLEHQYVKAVLDGDKAQVLTAYEKATNEEKYQLTTGTLRGASSEGADDEESVTYNLRLWLDENTPKSQMSKDFYAKIVIENITTSGAVKKEVLATGDISEAQDGSLTYTYYSTGELDISGAGRMLDDAPIAVLTVGNLIMSDDFTSTLTESEIEILSSDAYMALIPALTGAYHYVYMGYIGDSTPLCSSEPTTYEEYKNCLVTAEFDGSKLFNESHISLMDKIKEYYPMISSITINEGMQNVGEYAFILLNVDELILPSSVTEIGDYGFSGFETTNLELNEGIISVGNEAFARYSKIKEIIIPNTVTSIGNSVISESVVEKFVLPKNEQYTALTTYLFEDAQNTTIVIPSTITTNNAYSFADAKGLTINFEISEEDAPFKISVDGEKFIAVNYGYTE